jgi:hypothetical protein
VHDFDQSPASTAEIKNELTYPKSLAHLFSWCIRTALALRSPYYANLSVLATKYFYHTLHYKIMKLLIVQMILLKCEFASNAVNSPSPNYTIYVSSYTIYVSIYTICVPNYTIYVSSYTIYVQNYTIYVSNYTIYVSNSNVPLTGIM